MYTDYFLKFPDQATAEGLLFVAGEDDVLRPVYAAVDVIGTIYKPTGNVVDGEPEMAPLDGWHVNVRHNMPSSELAPYQVFPDTPKRTWF